MTDRSTESISALMDGEVADFELRRTLDRIDSEPELSEAWQRYHLIRSIMKNEDGADLNVDISASVMSSLELEQDFEIDESDFTEETQTGAIEKNRFWRPIASMAAAASVTAMVILGAQNLSNDPQEETLADNRPSYTLPIGTVSNDIVRAQFGNRSVIDNGNSQPDIIRLSQGVERYIDQHKHMLQTQKANWQASWLPDGFDDMRLDVMPHAEVQVFSNGRNSFSVCVEDYGRQTVPEGVAKSGDMVAVGKRIGDQFVTVVGDVPMMIAERIASSVERR
ncbi:MULTISPECIES: MucB/RseB C-terminal domain-containing protein [unclassified Neptuniibacter]|uniref:MucB/RseB C-terminal domain-containing protein n=1 Tax=unclassified Neptuniibacter TaxID=2630693 RepID=UPI0025D1CCBA|nr:MULTISPECIES: MucB/RseB C-terminal domain-containing protein [unclassified Neptuniibacter]|tara:strand:+ start:3418 stop:4257 length:840 start_codon:yes stop_codon:yes gene_type:complete